MKRVSVRDSTSRPSRSTSRRRIAISWANRTFEQFKRVIRTGVDLGKIPPNVPSADHDLLQVMPWPVYQDMTDHDLLAIYKYLSAIPHAEPGP
jgi:hypothetical protein